jgi:hypothetical protein
MEDRRFDQWTRALATSGTVRRVLLRQSVAGAIVVALARLGFGSATAGPPCLPRGERCRKGTDCCSGKCNKKRGKRKGKCGQCPTRCCIDADCDAGQICSEAGACVCPTGEFACCPPGDDPPCAATFVCCTTGTQACVDGACVDGCPPAEDWCNDLSIAWCGSGCGCATSAGGAAICADEDALSDGDCDCATDSDCDDGSVCIPSGTFCQCETPMSGHCVPVGCP